MIACVTFDFDGTLVDSNQVKVQSFYKIVEDYDPSGSTVTEVLQRCSHEDRYGITRELAREFMAKGLIPPHQTQSSSVYNGPRPTQPPAKQPLPGVRKYLGPQESCHGC